MIIAINFDTLVTFDCTYGEWAFSQSDLRVFVEKGLIIKKARLLRESQGVRVVEGDGETDGAVESLFPFHYLYDPVKGVEYVEWERSEGYLKARSRDGERIVYKCGSEKSNSLYEYVGGCWFVFSGVTFAKREIHEYASGNRRASGNKFFEEVGKQEAVVQANEKYLLEGVINASPGPGWMSLEIHAQSFCIEISDC